MSACGKGCNKRINPKYRIVCKVCNKEFHYNCAGILEKDITSYTSGENIWICEFCKKKIPTDNVLPEVTNSDICTIAQPTISDVYAIVKQILSEQQNITKTLENHEEEISELKQRTDRVEGDIEENKQKLNEISNIMVDLQKENEYLKSKLNEVDQQNRTNCLEITGVPEPGRGENIQVTVQLVCSALGVKLDASMINSCYRLRSSNDRNSSKIIVSFTKKCYKDEILKCRKIKTDFATDLLDDSLKRCVQDSNIIYINEFLTAYNKKLYLKAKEYKNKNKVKYLWVKNGNIFMRKSDNSKIIIIKSEHDFKNAV